VSDIAFRFATAGDAAAVHGLVERAYRGPEAAASWTNETQILSGPRSRLEDIAAMVRAPDTRFVLAEAGEALVGCALLRRDGDAAHFGMFAVAPDRQGAGLGSAVLAECEAVARRLWGSVAMTMRVISLREDIIAWYERRGYARTGESEPFEFLDFYGPLRTDFDLTVLRKALD
jgi:ribosomal protein S18 acetylase RimI-like enzyme